MNRAIAILGLIVFVSSLAVIHERHQVRLANMALHGLRMEQDRLLLEWGRISLELSSLANYELVERRAREELGLRPAQREGLAVLER